DDDDDDDNLDSILESVMTELLSKDILYEPLKELSTKYPDYLDNNKPPKLSQEDYDNFKKQHGYVNDVLAIFESDSPNKDS
ncbi:Pex19 protein, partial [Wallemia mellicola CBS 633.66]